MDVKQRFTTFFAGLPVAHRVVIVAALGAFVLAAAVFGRWVTTPSYTLMYSGLDDEAAGEVVDQLETQGVPYKLEAGGSRVLVPREQLYETRAALATAGVGGATSTPGYELLDEQGLSVSDFRQRVDYRRALEGELSKTLTSMDGIRNATVHLVIPEEELFEERQEPVTTSVLLDTTRPLNDGEIETVTFLVASSVEGLGVEHVTVADAGGQVLHAPGDSGGTSGVTNRNMRQTRDFEAALSEDVTRLLERTSDSPASVVVRADMNYDEQRTEAEAYDEESQVALREQLSNETFLGEGVAPGGAVGVDGGPVDDMAGNRSDYERDESLTEFGVDKVTTVTESAPGVVEGLSVAIVMDNGELTGAEVPPDAEIEELVTAALGLQEERGDAVAVSTVAFPPMAEEPEAEPEHSPWMGLLPQIVGVLVLLIVSIALFLMSRRRRAAMAEMEWEEPIDLELEEGGTQELDRSMPELDDSLRGDVSELVQRQPEEIAHLLRGWLADRRSA